MTEQFKVPLGHAEPAEELLAQMTALAVPVVARGWGVIRVTDGLLYSRRREILDSVHDDREVAEGTAANLNEAEGECSYMSGGDPYSGIYDETCFTVRAVAFHRVEADVRLQAVYNQTSE